MKIDTLIFDPGNVLADWNPAYLYKKIFTGGGQLHYFLAGRKIGKPPNNRASLVSCFKALKA